MLIGEDDPAAELVAALIAEGECGTVVVSSYLQKLGGGRIVTIRGWSREKHVMSVVIFRRTHLKIHLDHDEDEEQ